MAGGREKFTLIRMVQKTMPGRRAMARGRLKGWSTLMLDVAPWWRGGGAGG